ncbi:CBS domain-containing protein [bacterium]|nr:CBS domain-containing protein [bacterium]
MEIIVTHLASDFDSFAGMVAAKKIFPSGEIILPSSLNQNVREFMILHEDDLPQFKEISDIDLNDIKKVVMIDTRIPGRIGQIQKIVKDPDVKIITIDHHQKSREDINAGKNYFKKVGSTTTIIVQEIIKRKIDITQFEATLFMLGIYEDTGNFTYPNTSSLDLDAGSFLLGKGANLFVVSKFLNLALSEEQHVLLERLIFNSWKIKINEKEILLSKTASDSYVEGLSVLTRKLALVEESDIVFCWVKMKEKVYIVGRSDDVDVDISKILLPLGGGGHQLAASSVVKDTDFEKIEKILIDSLKKNIKKPVVSKNIMTFPVRLIEENKSIAYASELLKKYGHSGIPIVNTKGILTGIITRKDIDKAIKHGLSHAPVKGFKSGDIITATPETTLEEIQRLMIENGVGRIPIILKNKIIGIITRKDLLRSLNYKDVRDLPEINISEKGPDYFKVNIRERIDKLFPETIKDELLAISNLAKELKYKVYLVGGVVRDILLNKPNLDIDIVVEGDGINFSNKLANRMNAKVWMHKKFKTSVIVLENKRHIDVATARIEYYEKPAALPNVEEASIKQDLYRRDFTINSMAISLNKENYMTLLDFFGGRRDLKNRKIKVMHKLSFVEDPTRIFRAVRFEQRFAFKIDITTENLIRSAIEMEIISKLTGVRIRDELIAILEEDSPGKPLKRLYEYGALEKINIHIKIDTRFENRLIKILSGYNKIKQFYGENLKKWRLVFCILLSDFNEEDLVRWCSDMKVRKKDMEVILNSVRVKNSMIEKLGNCILGNSELYITLKNVPAELQVILYSYGSNIMQNIINYAENLKDVRLSVNGDMLMGLGFKHGEEIGKALEKLLLLKLDGKIKSSKDEILQAKSLLASVLLKKDRNLSLK